MSSYEHPAVPLLRVDDGDGSAGFYPLLGFEIAERRDEDDRLVWARLVSGAAELMLVEQPGDVRTNPGEAAVLYLYPPDVAGLHAALLEQGVTVGPLRETEYGMLEFELVDPDGHELWFGAAVGRLTATAPGPAAVAAVAAGSGLAPARAPLPPPRPLRAPRPRSPRAPALPRPPRRRSRRARSRCW